LIEPEVTFLLSRRSQLRRQVSFTQGAPPEAGVVRAIPRDVAERGQGYSAMSASAGQLAAASASGPSSEEM
jgi:hypothetical protein